MYSSTVSSGAKTQCQTINRLKTALADRSVALGG